LLLFVGAFGMNVICIAWTKVCACDTAQATVIGDS